MSNRLRVLFVLMNTTTAGIDLYLAPSRHKPVLYLAAGLALAGAAIFAVLVLATREGRDS